MPEGSKIVRREVVIAGTPETVFSFLTDAAKMARWAGMQVESDPRPGGVHRTVINPGHIISGEYLEVVPSERIMCTWGWVSSLGMPPGSSTVEIVLAPDNRGTVLRLAHSKLPADAREGHGEVWDHYLPRLAAAASGGDPGADPWGPPPGTEL